MDLPNPENRERIMGILGLKAKEWVGVGSALIFAFSLLLGARVFAEASGPDFFKVSGVAPNDVLNIRADAGASHAKIGEIPADADHIRNLGCVGGLSFAEWQNASEEERAGAAKTRWCRIEYTGFQGWVAGRYLTEGSAPAEDSDSVTPALWQIVKVGGVPVEGEAEIVFTSDGGFYGSTGCNRFQGQAVFEKGLLLVREPMATTRMACPGGRLDSQERDVLAILESGPRVQYNPLEDEVSLVGASVSLSMRLVRGQ
jgi:heat shock protein HslJ